MRNKILIFLLLSLFIFNGIASAQESGDVDATIGSWFMNPPSSGGDTGDSGSGGIDSGDIRDLEDQVSKDMQKIIELQQTTDGLDVKIAELETELARMKLNNTEEGAKIKEGLVSQLEEAQNKLRIYNEAVANFEQSYAALQDAYTQVAAEYGNTGVAGDPVNIVDGSYLCENTDFCAEDFGDVFILDRNWNGNNYSGSFGKGWSCSLDTRIIRCAEKPQIITASSYETILSEVNGMLQQIEDYRIKNNTKDALKKQFNTLTEKKELCEAMINYLSEYEEKYADVKKRNTYGSFGKYSDSNNLYEDYNLLVFIEENGREYVCKAEENNWIPYNPIASTQFTITNTSSNGYEIKYTDGSRKLYDYYGIITEKTDANGNKTKYKANNGRISEITLKTGEVLKITRDSKNKIVKISGNVSGFSNYEYNGEGLKSVTRQSGEKISYEYSKAGEITEIKSSVSEPVKVTYEYSDDLKKNVVSSVTAGKQKEYFSYDFKNKKAVHTDFAGIKEYFYWNSDGQISKRTDGYGHETIIQTDDRSLPVKIKKDGVEKTISYKNYMPVSVRFYDGTYGITEYDSKGRVIHQVDRDGFYNDYIYDEKGNVLEVYYCGNLVNRFSYYKNGLIKTLFENGINYSYKYNSYGELVYRKADYPAMSNRESYSTEEYWNYDANNRLVKAIDVFGNAIIYGYGKTLNEKGEVLSFREETYANGLKKKTFYDTGNREVKREETDTSTGRTICRETFYTSGNLVSEIKIDGKSYVEYFYTKGNLLEKYYVWELQDSPSDSVNGILTEIKYDSKFRKTSETRSKVCKNVSSGMLSVNDSVVLENISYIENTSGKQMTVSRGTEAGHKYFFDIEGRLVKIQRPDGGYEIREYTSSGKIKKIQDNKSNVSNFSYKNDGTVIVKEYANNSLTGTKLYDKNGRLSSCTNTDGFEATFIYDSKGNIQIEHGITGDIYYGYDLLDRVISRQIFDNENKLIAEKTYSYDDSAGEVVILTGDKYENWYKRDVWGRIVNQIVGGIETVFDYDSLGNCIKTETSDGDRTVYSYDCTGNVVKALKGYDTEKYIEEYSYDLWNNLKSVKRNGKAVVSRNYDDNGLLITEIDSYGNKSSYTRDENGNVIGFANNETQKLNYSYDSDSVSRRILTENPAGDVFELKLNNSGLITEEVNYSGDSIRYEYSKAGKLLRKTKRDGNQLEYNYLSAENKKIISSSSGEKYSIDKDTMNRITGISSNKVDLEYEYDTGGKLTLVKDKNTNLETSYFYNQNGNCIEKKNLLFDFVYNYNSKGLVSNIDELYSRASVEISYDRHNREVSRTYSNNVSIITNYDSSGNVVAKVSKEPYGRMITGEFYIYDEKGRVELSANEKGEIRRFTYDSDGRLITVLYPYDEKLALAYDEAVICGNGIKEERPAGVVLGLSADEKHCFDELAAAVGVNLNINRNQYCWKEEIEYTGTGNISKVKNGFGSINYSYDKDNRLLSKTGNSSSIGEFYTWSKNGSLLSIKNSELSLAFTYGVFERPVVVEEQNLKNGKLKKVSFDYDALGRRIQQKVYGETAVRFLYDGLTSNLLAVSDVYENDAAIISYSPLDFQNSENPADAYRYMDTTGYTESTSVRGVRESEVQENEVSEIGKTYGNVYSVLSVNNSPSVYIYRDLEAISGYSAEFMIHNKNDSSIIAATDKNASCVSVKKYDVWGEVIGTDYGTSSFSGSDNTLDFEYQMYDLGFRDYLPSMKSFSTEDPMRAGGNWYAYCSCDPVNYIDVNGFYKSGLTKAQKANYAKEVSKYIKFSEEDYKAGKNNTTAVVPYDFDCADVSAWIDMRAAEAAGISGYSEMATNFKTQVDAKKLKAAQNATSSSSYWDSYTNNDGEIEISYDSTVNVTKVADGWNSDIIKKGTNAQKAAEKAIRAENIVNIRNPDIVTPGSVLVWKKTGLSSNPNWTGHTATVVSRKFDANGDISGFVVIQGHFGGKKTHLEFIDLNKESESYPSPESLSYFMGEFLGVFEIQGNQALGNCGN